MERKFTQSMRGKTVYWIHHEQDKPCIVFVHGLTANHRLFDGQLEYFKQRYTVIVWDVPLGIPNGFWPLSVSALQGYDNMRMMLTTSSKEQICQQIEAAYKDVFTRQQPVQFQCPVLLLDGDKDRIGKAAYYNQLWAQHSGYPLQLVANAGHNANADQPRQVNQYIGAFLQRQGIL